MRRLTHREMHVGNGSERGKESSTCPGHGYFGIGAECPKCKAEREERAKVRAEKGQGS